MKTVETDLTLILAGELSVPVEKISPMAVFGEQIELTDTQIARLRLLTVKHFGVPILNADLAKINTFGELVQFVQARHQRTPAPEDHGRCSSPPTGPFTEGAGTFSEAQHA
jgi:acyl carrier protein